MVEWYYGLTHASHNSLRSKHAEFETKLKNQSSIQVPVCVLFSLHFTATTHNGVTSYHTPQGSQALPTSEADFVSDLSQGMDEPCLITTCKLYSRLNIKNCCKI